MTPAQDFCQEHHEGRLRHRLRGRQGAQKTLPSVTKAWELKPVHYVDAQLSVNLVLPENRRFTRAFELFGPIDPSASKFRVLPMKCEITLAKADGRSWPSIEKPKPEHAGMFVPQLTFSAGGGRGTTGATEAVLDGINKMRASS